MTSPADAHAAPGAAVTGDPEGGRVPAEQRGRTEVHDRVAGRIAERAALDVDGVVRHSSGLDKVTGRTFPRVEAHVNAGHVLVSMDVAVAWPAPFAGTAARVRSSVRTALAGLAGLEVDRVDVTAVPVSTDAPAASGKRRVR